MYGSISRGYISSPSGDKVIQNERFDISKCHSKFILIIVSNTNT